MNTVFRIRIRCHDKKTSLMKQFNSLDAEEKPWVLSPTRRRSPPWLWYWSMTWIAEKVELIAVWRVADYLKVKSSRVERHRKKQSECHNFAVIKKVKVSKSMVAKRRWRHQASRYPSHLRKCRISTLLPVREIDLGDNRGVCRGNATKQVIHFRLWGLRFLRQVFHVGLTFCRIKRTYNKTCLG